MSKYVFFCGIGGSGMMPLAYLMQSKGYKIAGSDRAYDQGVVPEKFARLKQDGFIICPQDGSGITPETDMLIVSSAVEDHIPDVKAAKDNNIPIRKRAEILAEFFNESQGIAVAGTSGKTTVTAMIGHILSEQGAAPIIVNGGRMINFDDQSAVIGSGNYFVTETDESDGSVALFKPALGVLNNVAHDHKTLDELKTLFRNYLNQCSQAIVINKDNKIAWELASEAQKPCISFSIADPAAKIYAKDIIYRPHGMAFSVCRGLESYPARLSMLGRHNISNALAALSAVIAFGFDLEKCCNSLEKFKGTRRRMEVVGVTDRGITLYDDFAHNPDKIAASLSALQQFDGRVIAFFQPHGFGPTKRLKNELIESFQGHLGPNDLLVMPEIYYAGGTAEKTISSKDITDKLPQGHFYETREDCGDFIAEQARPGDRIIIMGARDDSLSAFATDVFNALNKQAVGAQM